MGQIWLLQRCLYKIRITLCNQEVSGDDMFLLSAIKNKKVNSLFKIKETIADIRIRVLLLNDFCNNECVGFQSQNHILIGKL